MLPPLRFFCSPQQQVENSAGWIKGTPNHPLMGATLVQQVFHVALSWSTSIRAFKKGFCTLLRARTNHLLARLWHDAVGMDPNNRSCCMLCRFRTSSTPR